MIGDRVWVVDPVDGTANFARGIPHFCISIAYVENRQTEIGAIYNPALNELYFARRGEGQRVTGSRSSCADGTFRCGLNRNGLVDPHRECHLS